MEIPSKLGSPDSWINFPPLLNSLLFIFVILKCKGALKERWERRRIMVHAYFRMFFSEFYVLGPTYVGTSASWLLRRRKQQTIPKLR
jgi:hypothetical protein